MFLYHFNTLILKIIFLKKYYFNKFLNKKHLKKQSIISKQALKNLSHLKWILKLLEQPKGLASWPIIPLILA